MGRMACLIFLAVLVTGCTARDERIAFDGQFYRTKVSRDGDDRANFVTTVSPVSASLDGAREAGRYEGTRYCIDNYGTSKIDWTVGPDTDPETLIIDRDALTFQGRCDP